MAQPGARPSQRKNSSSDDILARMRNAASGKPAETEVPAESAESPAAPVVDERPAMRRRSEKKQQQGINWDTDLLEYSRDVTTRFKRAYPEAGIPTLAALVDIAVREKLSELERKYNDGRAFPPLV